MPRLRQRYVLSLTDAGRAELLQRLRKPADHEITDSGRFFTILAFLSPLLPATPEQHAVLRRRLEFLEKQASFFYQGERPLRAEDVADPYRRGMLLVARAISHAERGWLHEVLHGAAPGDASGTGLPEPQALGGHGAGESHGGYSCLRRGMTGRVPLPRCFRSASSRTPIRARARFASGCAFRASIPAIPRSGAAGSAPRCPSRG